MRHCDSWGIRDNLMFLVIKFRFTSSILNMFRTLIHPSSGACDFSIESPHWSCVLVSMCVGVCVWWIPPHPNPTTLKLPTHIETRTHDQCGDSIEKSQDGCINVRNMLSIEDVKRNLITSDIKLVSFSSKEKKNSFLINFFTWKKASRNARMSQ